MERTAEGAQWHELLHAHLRTKPPSVCSSDEIWFYPTTAQPSTLGVGQGGLELVILQLQ